MKVGIYTIAKDESANVKSWLKNVADADSVTFVDTGSGDNTPDLVKAHAKSSPGRKSRFHLHHALIEPWRFDTAHNVALSLVPADVDVCIPLHLDERLSDGWRDALEEGWQNGATKCFYEYQFAPDLVFLQNRIHARRGYVWRYPDHEGVYPWMSKEITVVIPKLRIVQHQDRTKDRSKILFRLMAAQREYPNDSRMTFYYGRELMYYGRYLEAIQYLRKYLDMPGGFPVEQRQACEHLAFCFSKL